MRRWLTGLAFVGMALCGMAEDYRVGDYRLTVQRTGAFLLYYHDNLVTQSDPFTAHNPQWKWIFGGHRFQPTIKADVKDDKVEILCSAANDVMSDFSERLILTAEGLSGTYSGTVEKEIFDFSVTLKLASGIYGGQRYKVEKGNGGIKSGILSPDAPASPQWDLVQSGNTIKTLMFSTDYGISTFSFIPSQAKISDTRSAKNTFVTLYTPYSKIQAGTKWLQQFTVMVKPASAFPVNGEATTENPKSAAAGTPVAADTTARDAHTLTNKLLTVKLDHKTNNISSLYYSPDDAELIRRINPGDYYKIGLRWSNNNTADGSFATSTAGHYALKREKLSNHLQLTEVIGLRPDTSILSFDTTIKNNSDKEVNDALQGSTGIIPGRIENELNPHALAAVKLSDGSFKSYKIVDLWGEYSHRGASSMALIDREMKSVWTIDFPQASPECLVLHVGKQDSHGGRDFGKRTAVEWNYPDFKLKAGELAPFKHHIMLFKGLRGVVALRSPLAINAQWRTKVVKPGETACCQLEFAAAAALDSSIDVKYQLVSVNGQTIASGSKTFPVKLAASQSVVGELEFPVNAEMGAVSCLLEFSDTQGRFGHAILPLATTGSTAAELRQKLESLKRELVQSFQKVAYPGAETPVFLTAYAKAQYHLRRAEAHLGFDELTMTAAELRAAEKNHNEMVLAATAEATRPVADSLRGMKSIKTMPRVYSVGNKLYSPEGIRLFLQGMCDTDQFNRLERIFHQVIDPEGELDTKKPVLETLRNPRLRRLAINALVATIRKYGNAHSQYVDVANLDKPEYRDFMLELLEDLKRQGIWTSVFIGSKGWNIYSEADKFSQYQRSVRDFTVRFMDMPNLTHTVVVSPEPLVQRPSTNPKHWQEFRAWYARRYHDPGRLTALGYGDDSKLAVDLLSESVYSPVTVDYVDFLGEIIGDATESMIKLYHSIGLKNDIYLGYSIWCAWPLTIANVFQRFTADPRIKGYCLDKYLGGWWGAESNPPELAWTGDLQYSSYKPMIMGEWGSGVAMPATSWKHGLASLKQSFGRNYFVHGMNGMYAWSSAWTGWNNMFEFNGTPLAATRYFCERRDAIVSSPVSHENKILSLASIKGMPRYIAMAQIRLTSCLPLIGTAADTGDIGDLEAMGPEKYRLLIVHTEGVKADKLTALRQLKSPVLLLGRPASEPDKSGVGDWISQKLFLKSPAARYSAGGAPRSFPLNFVRDFGTLKHGAALPHNFAANRSAWVKPEYLMDDVEIIAKAKDYAVLMRQGNLYWYTDMLGIESVDMPAGRAPAYPALQSSELRLVANMLSQSGIPWSDDPVSVRIVNDAAVLYDARSGHVEFCNANAFKLPEGMFPRAYELFSDGVVLLIGGERLQENNPVVIRCMTVKVKKVTLDGKEIGFDKLNGKHILINIQGKGAAPCDIRVYY